MTLTEQEIEARWNRLNTERCRSWAKGELIPADERGWLQVLASRLLSLEAENKKLQKALDLMAADFARSEAENGKLREELNALKARSLAELFKPFDKYYCFRLARYGDGWSVDIMRELKDGSKWESIEPFLSCKTPDEALEKLAKEGK